MDDEPKQKSLDKKWWNPVVLVLITVGLFLAAQFIAGFVFIFIGLGAGWDSQQLTHWAETSAAPQFINIVVVDGIILGGLWLVLKRRRFTFKDIGWSKKVTLGDLGRAVIAYIVYAAIFLVTSSVAKALIPALNLDQEQKLGFQTGQGGMSLLLAAVSLVILPPIVEELLTRGFLYTGLRSKMKYVPAMIVTSIVFASAHLQFGSDAPLLWVAAIDTFTLSIVLVYLREKTGRLTSSMMLHMLKNAIAFYVLFIAVR